MSNIYYSPEQFGLELVKDVEWSDEAYQFCQTALWRDHDGNFYVATDSGCSCPSPFEGYTEVKQLDQVLTFGDLLVHVEKASKDHYFTYAGTMKFAALVSAYRATRYA